jgi:5-methyltetrahydropteroyltriglutamate--homocysteine methyltransferase
VTLPLFPTQEVGGLPTPSLEALREWEPRVHFLSRLPDADPSQLNRPDAPTLQDLRAAFGIAYFEAVGLDRIYDGGERRAEMFEQAARQISGLELQGHVRSWDSRYLRRATAVDRVDLLAPYHLDEFDFVQAHARSPLKLPITGPYTLADGSYDDYYLARQPGWKGRAARRAAEREFVIDLARRVLRPTLQALIERGCAAIQVDEPAAAAHPDEVELVVEGFNEATAGLDAEFSMHICSARYAELLPALLEAKRCRQWAWEFADLDAPGNDPYEVLRALHEYADDRTVGLGVVNVHSDAVETPKLIADRIERAARYLRDPRKIWVNPDCGFRSRSLEVAYAKLTAMVGGAARARARWASHTSSPAATPRANDALPPASSLGGPPTGAPVSHSP